MIPVKSGSEIELMKKAGQIVAAAHKILRQAIAPGVTTGELDRLAEDYILKMEGIPSFKGYKGSKGASDYPASICASVNEEVVHGIPGRRILKNGDIISIDIGVCYRGFHADAARTFPVGIVSPTALKLIEATRNSFFEGISNAVIGNRIADISASIQKYIEAKGFSVIREYVGHGIGHEMHEQPQIPNYLTRERGPRLSEGMTLAVEPMVNEGGYEVRLLDNLWTVVTKDGKLSAHYENTIVITGTEPLILTGID